LSAFPDLSSGILPNVLGEYSCGAVADSHRASLEPDGEKLNEREEEVKEEYLVFST
jgi:hypothetical protein